MSDPYEQDREDREDRAVNEENYLLAEAVDCEATEQEVALAGELERVAEASRRVRRNDELLFQALRRAGAL